MRLGQPVPTLSGGEAQRLKLAGFLAEAPAAEKRVKKGTLFLFDEPTTGLHFDDIAKLMGAFRKLLDAGHSLVVIEHNLDVIRAADWIIDLGPEGGEAGGEIVCTGTPEEVQVRPERTPAGALNAYAEAVGIGRAVGPSGAPREWIGEERGDPHRQRARAQPEGGRRRHPARPVQRDHRRVRVRARARWPSTSCSTRASGATSNRSTPTRGSFVQPAGRPEVDAVYGIPPTVAIEQRTSRGGRKSTVATTTEI
ncbi:MAG: hypothetical protein MPW14_19390 [Candidatus Manganitrophus sp.]|nr:MAG: hypothetical protein MPW14_19390 [Candidatus Manganitrophus sp.]